MIASFIMEETLSDTTALSLPVPFEMEAQDKSNVVPL